MKANKFVKTVRNSFGIEDLIFAGHDNDKAQAKKLKRRVKKGEISVDDIVTVATGFLALRGASVNLIAEQQQKIKQFYSVD